jgi:hypothetical protein
VNIPNSVTTIKNSAFADNQLTSVNIPSSVTAIKYTAFENNQLTSVSIPDSITDIQFGAFNGNHLTSITIGSNVVIAVIGTPAMGDYGESFRTYYYDEQGRNSGTYTYNTATGTWSK